MVNLQTKDTNSLGTLEELRDDLCKERNDIAYTNGVLDMYNETKKFITNYIKTVFDK